MVTGIIGKKVGMTQIFEGDGSVHPATVIKAGPCVVVQAKIVSTDGYEAVQLGLVEDGPAKVGKPLAGHFKKANVPPTRVRREVKVAAGGDAVKAGDQVLVSMFANGDRVDVIGTGRGKGFQGVVKRHHFAGGAATHGSALMTVAGWTVPSASKICVIPTFLPMMPVIIFYFVAGPHPRDLCLRA